MPDREKIINGLNFCTHTDGVECPKCPYWQDEDCVEALHADVLSLLKEQEVKEQISDAIHETAKQFRQTIVRCKDCKHYTGGINGYCERWFRKTGGNEFFCADGERR